MKRSAAAVAVTTLLCGLAGCNEAKQAVTEVVNDQKNKVRNQATESARQKSDEIRENATGGVSEKLRGNDGKPDEETED